MFIRRLHLLVERGGPNSIAILPPYGSFRWRALFPARPRKLSRDTCTFCDWSGLYRTCPCQLDDAWPSARTIRTTDHYSPGFHPVGLVPSQLFVWLHHYSMLTVRNGRRVCVRD